MLALRFGNRATACEPDATVGSRAADPGRVIALASRLAAATIDSLGDMKTTRNPGGLVYSTDGGRMCPGCREPIDRCGCRQPTLAGTSDGVVRVSRETKGRAGKGVTLIRGLALEPAALIELGRRLKAACGTGGTVKNGVIELRGDHCEAVIDSLRRQGCAVKRAGG
jgi:translation initiation factor 1